ncbi:MAG: pyridoxal phosphate-dependent class II aminotransferase [Litoreibacter sp.]|nr:pyridoxal phosphate-dependent class II aminotransferase [Litoreibacter sp.]
MATANQRPFRDPSPATAGRVVTGSARDHGGGLDAAIATYGGERHDWLDLSTGINPVPYPVGDIPFDAWTALPDRKAMARLEQATRIFWKIPDDAEVIAAPGASALIARIPHLSDGGPAHIPGPTYNEHAAAFEAHAQPCGHEDPAAQTHVYVHPNNPDGRLWEDAHIGSRSLTIIDESFCDVTPAASHIARSPEVGVLILKSFGKFWGLAGLRLGFAVASHRTLNPLRKAGLADLLGPWAVSGSALEIGARALEDKGWAAQTRIRLATDAARLDAMMAPHAKIVGGTDLFRLYEVDSAAAWQERLARRHIWSRIFPYSKTWVRLGLPAPDRWGQLSRALK